MFEKIIVIVMMCSLTIHLTKAQNVGINATGAAPDASAMLDVVSTNKGLLIPRIALTANNVAAPVTTPLTSLLVYNTATASSGATAVYPGYYYWDGTKWVALGGPNGRDWSLTGNAGTTASSSAIGSAVNNNFIGTTDTRDFVTATNNLERMRVTSAGDVGIGIINPSAKFEVHAGSLGATAGNSILMQQLTTTNANAQYLRFFTRRASAGADWGTSDLFIQRRIDVSDMGFIKWAAGDWGMEFGSGTSTFMKVAANSNIGINTLNPTEKLDVDGNVRFSGALMPNNQPGTTGYVLVSQGANTAPIWQSAASILKVYSVFATRTNVPASGSGTGWTDVTGLTQTITVNGPATFIIMTYGSLENRGGTGAGCGTEVKIIQNGVDVPNAYQTIDVTNTSGITGVIGLWSFQTAVTVATAGTYIFKVQARKYNSSFANFYAGGNSTAPAASQNQGALIIQEFDQ